MEAFKILYKGLAFDIAEGSGLNVEFVSSVFNDNEVLGGSFSYPVRLMYTAKNRSLLDHADLFENRQARKSVMVDVELLGMSWKKAKMVFSTGDKGFDANLLIDVGTVADWMKDRPLNSVFTVSNNGAFVSHIGISMGENDERVKDNLNASCSNPGSFPWVFYCYENKGVFGGGQEDPLLQSNIINQFEYIYRDRIKFSPDNLYNPSLYLTWVIKEVCKFLGFEARGSFLTDEFVRSLIIYNPGIVKKSITQDRMIYPAQHLPAISVNNFFKTLRNDMRCVIHFDSLTRIAHFELADVILNDSGRSSIDLSGMIVSSSRKCDSNETTGYVLKTKVDEGDNLYKIIPYAKNYVIGNNDVSKSLEMGIGTTFMRMGIRFDGLRDMYLPHVQQLGNVYDDDYRHVGDVYNPPNTYCKNEFELRLLSYKGITSIDIGLLKSVGIPFATSDHRDIRMKPTYDVSMQPGGENGYLSRMCLNWYRFLLTSEKVTVKARMDINAFLGVNPLRKMLIPGDMKSRVECLLDKVVLQPVGNDQLIAGTLTVYPNFNYSAVQGAVPINIEEGEIQKPQEKIYVRLEWENHKYWEINKKKEKVEKTSLVAFFYKDIHGTLPTKVNQLMLYIAVNGEGDFNKFPGGNDLKPHDDTYTVTAEGSAVLSGDQVTYYYRKGGLADFFRSYSVTVRYGLNNSPTSSYEIIR